MHRPPGRHGAPEHGQVGVRADVGQLVGADRAARQVPDGEVGPETGLQAARGVVAPGLPAAPGVGAERRGRREPLAVAAVGDGRPHRLPRAERGDGRVGAECEAHPLLLEVAQRDHPPPPLTEAFGVHAVGASPQGVEDGLHRGDHAEAAEHLDHASRGHLDVLHAVAGGGEHRRAEPGRGPLEARRDVLQRRVADRVEAGLHAEPGAQRDVLGDGAGVEDGVAAGGVRGAARVGVGREQRGRARADRAVGVEVAGQAGDAEPLEGVDGAELAPVDDGAQPGLVGGAADQVHLVLGAHVRGGVLVEPHDPDRGHPAHRGAGGLETLVGADQGAEHDGDGVVGVALDASVGRPAVEVGQARHGVGQRGADHRRVALDAPQAHPPAGGGALQLGAGGGTVLGPGRLVPAGAEQDAAGALARGVGGHPVQAGGQARDAGQVELGLQEAGGHGVHVGVDEGRGDPGAVEVDDLVGALVGAGQGVVAGGQDDAVLDDHAGVLQPLDAGVDDAAAQEQPTGARPGARSTGGAVGVGGGHGASLSVRRVNSARTPSWRRSSARASSAWPGA